jgi:hypothetical protein
MEDKLIMLLSSDWFFGSWESMALELNDRVGLQLKVKCRDIVKQILGSATQYWLTSFAEDRTARTHSLFLQLLRDLEVPEAFRQQVEQWLQTSYEDILASGVHYYYTLDLVEKIESGECPIASSHAHAIADLWNAFSQETPEETSLSRTQWDRYLAELTPDLPTYLWETAVGCIRYLQLRLFWKALRQQLPESELAVLENWYRRVAVAKSGRPSWMKTC